MCRIPPSWLFHSVDNNDDNCTSRRCCCSFFSIDSRSKRTSSIWRLAGSIVCALNGLCHRCLLRTSCFEIFFSYVSISVSDNWITETVSLIFTCAICLCERCKQSADGGPSFTWPTCPQTDELESRRFRPATAHHFPKLQQRLSIDFVHYVADFRLAEFFTSCLKLLVQVTTSG